MHGISGGSLLNVLTWIWLAGGRCLSQRVSAVIFTWMCSPQLATQHQQWFSPECSHLDNAAGGQCLPQSINSGFHLNMLTWIHEGQADRLVTQHQRWFSPGCGSRWQCIPHGVSAVISTWICSPGYTRDRWIGWPRNISGDSHLDVAAGDASVYHTVKEQQAELVIRWHKQRLFIHSVLVFDKIGALQHKWLCVFFQSAVNRTDVFVGVWLEKKMFMLQQLSI